MWRILSQKATTGLKRDSYEPPKASGRLNKIYHRGYFAFRTKYSIVSTFCKQVAGKVQIQQALSL